MQTFVELPEPIKALILMAFTLAVTEALKLASAALKYDLSGYAAQVTSALVAATLIVINAVFSHIPAEVAPIANSVLDLIVVLLGSWGAYKTIRQFQG